MLKSLTDAQAEELKKALAIIGDIPEYGSIKIQVRQGKPTLATIERTVKLD